jgi:RimJ/RimL family protein N-acetyltransferase
MPDIQLIAFDRRHLAATLVWINDPVLMRLLGRTRAVQPDEHERWFDGLARRNDCQYFAIETVNGGRHIGNVWLWDINRIDRRAEVRVLIGQLDDTSKGLGTEAIDLVANYAFTALNLHKVYAYVLAYNPRAKRAFEKAGFQSEGLLRSDRWTGEEFVDVHLLGRLKGRVD